MEFPDGNHYTQATMTLFNNSPMKDNDAACWKILHAAEELQLNLFPMSNNAKFSIKGKKRSNTEEFAL